MKNQSLSFMIGPPSANGVVDDPVGGVAGLEAPVGVAMRQIARLPVARAARHLEVAAEAIAALARNHVQADAARRRLGADPAVW